MSQGRDGIESGREVVVKHSRPSRLMGLETGLRAPAVGPVWVVEALSIALRRTLSHSNRQGSISAEGQGRDTLHVHTKAACVSLTLGVEEA
jgi:hypothetical protein